MAVLAAQANREGYSGFHWLMAEPIVHALYARLRADPVAFAQDTLPTRMLALGVTAPGFPVVTDAVMCLLATGRSAEVKTWYDGLDATARRPVSNEFSLNEQYRILGRLVREVDAPLQSEADTVVVRVLTDPVFIALCRRAEVLGGVQKYGNVIPDDRLAELGPRIATKVPNGGRTWVQLAEDLAKLDQTDASLEAWAKAVAAVDDSTRGQAPDWTLAHCQGLAEAGRVPEALAAAQSADTTDWNDWKRKKLAKLIAQWGGGSAKPEVRPESKSVP